MGGLVLFSIEEVDGDELVVGDILFGEDGE
jgi:hypothetical protein